MSTFTIEQLQAQLPDLIDKLQPGEEITITRDTVTVARLIATGQPKRPPRQPGTLKGTVIYMAADFNAPLEEFKEYTP